MNVPETVALVETALNTTSPVEARRAALSVLEKMGISELPITEDQKTEIIWAQVLTAGPEQHKAWAAERLAKEDAERRFCGNCFLRQEPIMEESCTRCGQGSEWVIPSTIDTTRGLDGWVLRVSEAIGQMDKKELTQRLYISSDIREHDITLAKLILRIFDTQEWERPLPPFGNPNNVKGSFYLTQDEPKPEPQANPKTLPDKLGHWSVTFQPNEFKVW